MSVNQQQIEVQYCVLRISIWIWIEIIFIREGVGIMFAKQIETVDQLPLADRDRKCTDVCCTFCFGLFVLLMLIISLSVYQRDHYFKVNFPTDSDFRSCSHDLPGYPYLYFADPSGNAMSKRICVSSCPKRGDSYLLCSPTKTLSCKPESGIQIYDTRSDTNRLGGFCLPTNKYVRDKLIEKMNLQDKWKFLNFFDIVKLSLLLAIFVGVIHLCVTHCLPTLVVWISPLICSVLFFILSIVLLTSSLPAWEHYNGLRVLLGLLFLIFSFGTLALIFTFRRHLKLSGVFLKYATRFLAETFCLYFYIPLFLLLSIGVVALCTWQYVAFSTAGDPYAVHDDIYWRAPGSSFLQVLNFIEFIWLLQFLRDSFNFVISGNSVEWYFSHKQTHCEAPLKRLFRRHLGSVIGGSFLNGFLLIPDLIFDSLRCQKRGCMGKYAGCCEARCWCCDNLFELVRTDVYAYINLTGIPYCNSARNCELLCRRTSLFSGSHSCLQMYRAASNWINIGLVLLMCYSLMKGRTSDVSLLSLLLIGILAWCTSTYFIGLHTDAAEGLQVSFLMEHVLEHDSYRTMIRCPPGLRVELETVDSEISRPQGNC